MARKAVYVRAWRWTRLHYLRVIRMDDTPEKIAGGLTLGVMIGILPSFGLGLIIAVFIAGWLRLNKASALIGTLIMNPWTAPFFWAISYITGSLMLGQDLSHTIEIVKSLKSGEESLRKIIEKNLLEPYILGNIVVTAIVCAAAYTACLYLVNAYRDARAKKRLKSHGVAP